MRVARHCAVLCVTESEHCFISIRCSFGLCITSMFTYYVHSQVLRSCHRNACRALCAHAQPSSFNTSSNQSSLIPFCCRAIQLNGCQITDIITLTLTPPWTPTLPMRGTSGRTSAGFGTMMYVLNGYVSLPALTVLKYMVLSQSYWPVLAQTVLICALAGSAHCFVFALCVYSNHAAS